MGAAAAAGAQGRTPRRCPWPICSMAILELCKKYIISPLIRETRLARESVWPGKPRCPKMNGTLGSPSRDATVTDLVATTDQNRLYSLFSLAFCFLVLPNIPLPPMTPPRLPSLLSYPTMNIYLAKSCMLFFSMSGRWAKERIMGLRKIPSCFRCPSASHASIATFPPSPEPSRSAAAQKHPLSPTHCHAYSYQHLVDMYRLYPLHQTYERKRSHQATPLPLHPHQQHMRHVVVSHPHKTNELHTVASCFLEPIKSLSAPSSRPIRLLLSPLPTPNVLSQTSTPAWHQRTSDTRII